MKRLLLRLLLALCATGGFACGETATETARPTTIAVGEVLQEARVFVDASRPTRANGTAPASDRRTLATLLWYAPMALDRPACAGDRCALVLLAHGFGGRTSRFDAIARLLAAAGYIVAAPAFPLTNQDTPGGHLNGLTDGAQQPADVSFVIDRVLAADADRNDPLHRRVDRGRIGVVGHSLGGTTLIGATRTPCCTDARIDAAVLVAPVAFAVSSYYGAPPRADGPPVLVVNGSDDPLVRPDASREFVHRVAPPWYFLEIPDVGHVFLIENIGAAQPFLHVTARAATAFFDEYLGGAVGETAAELEALVGEGQIAEYAE